MTSAPFFGDAMAREGAVPAFRDAATNSTVQRAAPPKGSAPVSQVAPGSSPSAGQGEKCDDGDLLRFFDLKRNPFSGAPEEEFFCSNAAVRQVFRELIAALSERSGCVVLTGEAGVGKTTLLRRIRRELIASGHLVIVRYRPGLFFDDLARVISEEMQIPAGNDDPGAADEVGITTRLREQLERTPCAAAGTCHR